MCFLLAFKRYGAVEYRLAGLAVRVYVEVADALELEMAQVWQVCSPFFNVRVVVYAQ